MARTRKLNHLDVVDTFIQPKVLKILHDISLKYGFSKQEAEKYYLMYYKEFLLKSMTVADFTHLRIIGFGYFYGSKKKSTTFSKSKYCNDLNREAINSLIENGK
jgi:hypothetical protein